MRVSAPTSTPRKRYVPLVGTSRQPRMFIAVDLPEPLGPMTATNSPSATCRSTRSSACTAAWPVPYTFVTSENSMTGAMTATSSS